jgi:hypothetical protein
MANSISDEEMAVLGAIRQSFEMSAGAGSAVNANPNPFYIGLNGQFDLLRAAKAVVERLAALHEVKAKAFAAQVAKEAADLAKGVDTSPAV